MVKRVIDEAEIAINRAITYYRNRGYDDKWIETRIKGILNRHKLTDVRKDSGITENYEYGIFTNEIYKSWSGMKANECKAYKKYDLYIATDYVWREISESCGYVVEQKFNWLRDNLPFIKPQQYIFLADKRVLSMDIRIDDKINNLDGTDVKLLFSAYHNKNLFDEELSSLGIERMNSWLEIRDRLL